MSTSKDYLSQAFTIDRLLKARRSQILELEERRLAIGSMVISDDKVQTSVDASKFNHLSDLYIDLIAEYTANEQRLLELKREISDVIDALRNPVHRLIMFERYVNLKRWERIAADNNYSYDYLVNTLHRKALREVKNMLEHVG